jgi:hypothetical protein
MRILAQKSLSLELWLKKICSFEVLGAFLQNFGSRDLFEIIFQIPAA